MTSRNQDSFNQSTLLNIQTDTFLPSTNQHFNTSTAAKENDIARNVNNMINVSQPDVTTNNKHFSCCLQFCLLNTRSVRNKAMIIKDYVVDNNIDVLALTETWLRPDNVDDVEIGILCPTGYRFYHVPRCHSKGGGVGVLFKDCLNINTILIERFQSFEIMDVRLRSLRAIRILIIYRPPDTTACSLFFEEFSRLLEEVLAETPGHLILTGDFNFHMDSLDNANACRFTVILHSYGLKQHVCGSTHANGHTLDLVITKSDETLINCITVSDPVISDHLAVHYDLYLRKPQFTKKLIKFRKLRRINMDSFTDDIAHSNLIQEQEPSDLNTLVAEYNNVLGSLLDKYAPLKHSLVTIRPNAPWYTPEVAIQKNKRRRLERKWRSTMLDHDRELYKNQCGVVNNLIDTLKSSYYTTIIKDHSSDQKVLFKTVDKLLQKPREKRYPPSNDDISLANSFADYFISKIDIIYSELVDKYVDVEPSLPESSTCPVEFCNFSQVTQDEVKRFVVKPSSKSCILDPLPASILKGCLTTLLPTITKIVNLSLSTGNFPDAMKTAAITPSLKKLDADHEQFKNFRPISNLTFVSKVIEKAVAVQLTEHIKTCYLDEVFQSAYKTFHSTETALLRVQNDVLCALDKKESVILLLLDLSAAFDTVHYPTLLSRLSIRFGIRGKALAWFETYLTSRQLFVNLENAKSSLRSVVRGVPQGSVLGPLLYSLYTSPIADIIKRHNLDYHLYADDTQLYISFKTNSFADLCTAKSSVQLCVKDIDRWMTNNMLKLNQDKTELVVISSKFHPRPFIDSVLVGDECICPKVSARNLGVILDECLSMEEHIRRICSVSQYHLRNIAKIRKYLTNEATEILIHAFISSKLDNCNSLLYGLPKCLISQLQSIQNTAARIVTSTKKFDHITPALFRLHWLPVQFRISFKILLLVYKALHGLAPVYIADLLHHRPSSRPLRSTSQELLLVPKSRLKTYGDRAFSVAAPTLWNKLPLELRKCPNVDNFKNNLKTYLFKLAFNN